MSKPAGPPSWDDMPESLREQLMMSREQYEEIHARMAERETRVPNPGDVAPDFDLKRLDEKGALTEERLQLSKLGGRPVALVFGSYT